MNVCTEKSARKLCFKFSKKSPEGLLGLKV